MTIFWIVFVLFCYCIYGGLFNLELRFHNGGLTWLGRMLSYFFYPVRFIGKATNYLIDKFNSLFFIKEN